MCSARRSFGDGEMVWQSNAEWDHKHGFRNNVTTDTHQTKEQAEAVCRGLKREGLGGERIHFPVRTWVSETAVKREAEFSGNRCPKCGASTLVNGVDEWCSFIGGQDQKACDWVKK